MKLNDIKERNIEEIAGSAILERGIGYFQGGRVRRIWLEGDMICASVIGSSYQDYTTKVWCTEEGLEWKCNCPYEGECCKHVVAVLYQFISHKEKLLNDLKEETQKITQIGTLLKNLSKEDLVEIIVELMRKNKNAKVALLGMLEKYPEYSNKDFIYLLKYEEYWGEIEPVIQEFNEHGGGPGEEEERVYDTLDKIVSLFKENKLSQDVKKEFIDNLFHYYDLGNSGFEDSLMDAIFDVASSKSDWEYIVEKLRKEETDWRKTLIMEIYRDHLHDEKSYLRERGAKLKYGLDYYDLSQFWYEKGDMEKAVEIAKEGLEKSEGRIIDLIEFLFEYYRNKDYENALKYASLKFEDDPCYTAYNELKRFCKKKDWTKIEARCLEKLKEHSGEEDLARVHWDKKEYDRVLEYVLNRDCGFFDEREEYADKLKEIYPQEILEFYKELIKRRINGKDRKSYREAACYAEKAKHIYTHVLKDAEEWNKYIQSIRSKYEKYPALQDEFLRL